MRSMASSPSSEKQAQIQFARVAFGLFLAASFLASAIGAWGQSESLIETATKAVVSVTPLVLSLIWSQRLFGLSGLALFLLSFAYGLFRGAVVWWPLEGDYTLLYVLAAAGITTIWWAVTFRVVKSWQEFSVQLSLLKKSGWDWISTELRNRVLTTAKNEMKNLQTSLLDVLTARASDAVSRHLTSQLITQNLRHAISSISGMRLSEQKMTPTISFTATLYSALKHPSFDLRFLTLGSAALSLLGVTQLVGFWRGLGSVAMSCLVLLLGASLLQAGLQKTSSRVLSLGLMIALAIFSVLLPDLMFQLVGMGSELSQIQILLGGPITTLTLLISSSFFKRVQLDRQRLVSEFALRLSDRELIDLYIHHSLQSELQSISMLYQESANQDSARLEELAGLKLADFSGRDLESEFRTTLSDPRGRLKRVLESWSPIVRISAEGFLTSEHSLSSLACRVIEEAISNSVRYGGSTEIKISSRLDRNKLRLEISANGGPVDADVQGGVGRRLLEVASYSWKITNTGNGTLLIVTIPFNPKSPAQQRASTPLDSEIER